MDLVRFNKIKAIKETIYKKIYLQGELINKLYNTFSYNGNGLLIDDKDLNNKEYIKITLQIKIITRQIQALNNMITTKEKREYSKYKRKVSIK